MTKKREDQNAISHNDLVVRLERTQVICPACGEQVEAVAADGWVKGYCAVAKQSVDFQTETQRVRIGKNPTGAKIFASVKRLWQDPEVKDGVIRDYVGGAKTIVIQVQYKISPGVMYRILHASHVKLRSPRKPKQ